MAEKIEILRCLVGSYAHSLATPESDYDYRSVYIIPTSELLKLGPNSYKATSWVEGENEDNTGWEIGHFLHLATHSNPSILEVFKAPIVETGNTILNPIPYNTYGEQLIKLFPYVWSSKGVYDAFKGYSHNQHKKMFDEKEEFVRRKNKYAVAHLRVLLQGIELLTTGTFSVKILHTYIHNGLHLHLPPFAEEFLQSKGYTGIAIPEKTWSESWQNFLQEIKGANIVPVGLVVNTAEYLKGELQKAYESNSGKETDMDKVNEFLLKVRKECW